MNINLKRKEIEDVTQLVDGSLINELSKILDLKKSSKQALIETLDNLYSEFLDADYQVENSLAEYEERAALMRVNDAAKNLHQAIQDLNQRGNTVQRFADAMIEIDSNEFVPEQARGVLTKLAKSLQPTLYLKHLIIDIQVAAERAADLPPKIRSVSEVRKDIQKCTNPEKLERLENELFFAEWDLERSPNKHLEYRKRLDERKIPKDLAIRVSIKVFKEFFERHVDYAFTAGKYYTRSENKGGAVGYNSVAVNALTIILKRVLPEVTSQNIGYIIKKMY